MSKDFEEYAKLLSEKVANIPPYDLHIMEKEEEKPLKEEMESALADLEVFAESDFFDFQKYENWLEDSGEPNQKR